MSDDRDPLLSELFARAKEDLGGGAFTAKVMNEIAAHRRRIIVTWFVALAILAPTIWLLITPTQGVFAMLMQAVPDSLVDTGDGFVGQLLAPVNSVAGILGIAFLAVHAGYRRIFR